MIRLIVYDLDGTLIDSRLDIANAVNWTLKELGRNELPAEKISGFVGSGVKNLMLQSLMETGQKPLPSLEKAIKLFRGRYGEHMLVHTELYPSVRKVLEFFHLRRQAVVTNKPENFSIAILQGLGVDSYFFQIRGGDTGFPKKPAPGLLLDVILSAEVSPGETLLVGDSALDVETGRNAGVKILAVTYGFGSRTEIEKAGPDGILEDLSELITHPLLGES